MIVLGLGSNQGDREQQLRRAVEALKTILINVRCSAVYESAPLLPKDAPAEWNIVYLNMAIAGEVQLAPDILLQKIKNLEQSLGRISRGHWGPREIDIDILACGDSVIDEEDLMVPHKELLGRDFALIPFAEIHPTWKYPMQGKYKGKTASELSRLVDSSMHKTDIIIQ